MYVDARCIVLSAQWHNQNYNKITYFVHHFINILPLQYKNNGDRANNLGIYYYELSYCTKKPQNQTETHNRMYNIINKFIGKAKDRISWACLSFW